MLLTLSYLLLAAQPILAQPSPLPAPELRLASDQARAEQSGAPASSAALPDLSASVQSLAGLPLLPAQAPGSGDGDHSDHPDHMSTMWIVMGGMMVVMMVGAGVYYMNHQGAGTAPTHSAALTGPAARALPVSAPGGG
jgi:hypothetical protein